MTSKITTIGAIVVPVGLASFDPVLYHDYNLSSSYGPGGLPHNALGRILFNALLRMMSVEMLNMRRVSTREAGYHNFFLTSQRLMATGGITRSIAEAAFTDS